MSKLLERPCVLTKVILGPAYSSCISGSRSATCAVSRHWPGQADQEACLQEAANIKPKSCHLTENEDNPWVTVDSCGKWEWHFHKTLSHEAPVCKSPSVPPFTQSQRRSKIKRDVMHCLSSVSLAIPPGRSSGAKLVALRYPCKARVVQHAAPHSQSSELHHFCWTPAKTWAWRTVLILGCLVWWFLTGVLWRLFGIHSICVLQHVKTRRHFLLYDLITLTTMQSPHSDRTLCTLHALLPSIQLVVAVDFVGWLIHKIEKRIMIASLTIKICRSEAM